MLISCLCVTHERPEWMPWLLHQVQKQRTSAGVDVELIVVDSSAESSRCFPYPIRISISAHSGISAKRNQALDLARGDAIAWFDDDDWQAPHRLQILGDKLNNLHVGAQIVGSVWSTRYNVRSNRTAPYFSLAEPVIFNSALYDAELAKSVRFDERLQTGEDTRWNLRLLEQRPSYSVLGGEELHAWMVHGKNISAVHRNVPFDLPSSIPFDAWELDFLAKLRV